MIVILHGKCLVPSLIERASAFSLAESMPAFAVHHLKPPHEFHHLAVARRPHDEVKVVGHHTVGQKSYRRSLLSFLEHLHE
jgi:hypothetical protein